MDGWTLVYHNTSCLKDWCIKNNCAIFENSLIKKSQKGDNKYSKTTNEIVLKTELDCYSYLQKIVKSLYIKKKKSFNISQVITWASGGTYICQGK